MKWYFGDGSNPETVKNPQHIYNTSGKYKISLHEEDQYGCRDSLSDIEISVCAQSEMTVPDIFTPNSDGSNDVFKVIYNSIENFEGKILNRWGELLYTWSDVNVGWDGTYQGKEVVDGVYFYVIAAKGKDKISYDKSGTIILIRTNN